MQTYLVGGAVRDQLLGLAVKDRDWVVVGATPDEMRAAGYQQVGADFPVFLHPETREEYALARTERKSGRGYTGFICAFGPEVTLEDDLKRRDLTINAMAKDQQGRLIDPYGGRADLNEKVLRHVSPAFAEDPLRVLRVARFYARFRHLGFRVAGETMDLMRQIAASGELSCLTPERVWQEIVRALDEPTPRACFDLLRDCHALGHIMPELDALFGIPQPPKYHPEIDTGEHSLLSLTEAAKLSESPRVRFAALVHDLGKALTPRQDWPRHIGHEHLGEKPVRALCARLKIPNAFRDLAVLSAQHHLLVHQSLSLRPGTLLKLITRCDALRRPERFSELLLVCMADARGRTGFEHIDYPQQDFLETLVDTLNRLDLRAALPEDLKGPKIAERIQTLRVAAIKQFKKDWAQRHSA